MKTYEGPWKAGMTATMIDGSGHDFVLERAMAEQWTKHRPTQWRPVRPADDDHQAWALFVPDESLPDTGPKVLKVGQVWAQCSDPRRSRVVIVAAVSSAGNADLATLSGTIFEGVASPFGAMMKSVLLFDAPAPVEAPKPAEPRRLAAGWKGIDPRPGFGCHGCGSQGQSTYEHLQSKTHGFMYCDPCATKAGVFADAPVAIAAPSPPPVLCLLCHRPDCSCTGTGAPIRPTRPVGAKPEPKRPKAPRCVRLGCESTEVTMRVVSKGRGAQSMCDRCYLDIEQSTERKMNLRDGEWKQKVEPPARVGTVSQVFGVGVGIWNYGSRSR